MTDVSHKDYEIKVECQGLYNLQMFFQSLSKHSDPNTSKIIGSSQPINIVENIICMSI